MPQVITNNYKKKEQLTLTTCRLYRKKKKNCSFIPWWKVCGWERAVVGKLNIVGRNTYIEPTSQSASHPASQ